MKKARIAKGVQIIKRNKAVATFLPRITAKVFLADQAIELPALAEILKKTAEQNKDTEVQLRSDETVPYGKVIEVIGIAQKAGLTRIGFIANPNASVP